MSYSRVYSYRKRGMSAARGVGDEALAGAWGLAAVAKDVYKGECLCGGALTLVAEKGYARTLFCHAKQCAKDALWAAAKAAIAPKPKAAIAPQDKAKQCIACLTDDAAALMPAMNGLRACRDRRACSDRILAMLGVAA